MAGDRSETASQVLSGEDAFPLGDAVIDADLTEETGIELADTIGRTFEELSDVNGGGGTEAGAADLLEGMVEFDGANDWFGQAPEAEKISADLGMRGAEDFPFHLVDRGAFIAASVHDDLVVGVGIRGHDQFANVVKEAADKRFFAGGFGQVLVTCKLTGVAGDADAVVPKFGRGDALKGFLLVKFESVNAEDDRAKNFETDDLDGFHGSKDFARDTEVGGIGNLKEFEGQAGIFVDDGADFLERTIRGINGLREAEIKTWWGGESAETSDDPLELFAADLVLEAADTLENVGEVL